MGSARVAPKILKVLTDNAGQAVTAEVIQQITGLELLQVQNAIARLISANGLPIKVMSRGQVWKYDARPQIKPALTVVPADEPTPASAPAPVKVGRPARNGRSRAVGVQGARPADTFVLIGEDKNDNPIVRNVVTGKLWLLSEL